MKKVANPRHAKSGLSLIGSKQLLPVSVLDKIALTTLVHLDACKRGRGDNASANVVTMHILISLALGSLKKNKDWYDLSFEAYKAMNKACNRPDPVSFTTGEYAAIKACIGPYLGKVLPVTNWSEYLQAEHSAFSSFNVEESIRKDFIEFSRIINE